MSEVSKILIKFDGSDEKIKSLMGVIESMIDLCYNYKRTIISRRSARNFTTIQWRELEKRQNEADTVSLQGSFLDRRSSSISSQEDSTSFKGPDWHSASAGDVKSQEFLSNALSLLSGELGDVGTQTKSDKSSSSVGVVSPLSRSPEDWDKETRQSNSVPQQPEQEVMVQSEQELDIQPEQEFEVQSEHKKELEAHPGEKFLTEREDHPDYEIEPDSCVDLLKEEPEIIDERTIKETVKNSRSSNSSWRLEEETRRKGTKKTSLFVTEETAMKSSEGIPESINFGARKTNARTKKPSAKKLG